MDDRDLLAHATQFMFPVRAHPELRYAERDAVYVELRDTDAWCVHNGRRQVLGRRGEWEIEPSPSGRTPRFLARTRFTRDVAVRMALAEVERRRAAQAGAS